MSKPISQEKVNNALYKYMLAHINLNSRCQLKNLKYIDVVEMFGTMIPPEISFEEWCDALQIDLTNVEELNEAFVENMKKNPNVKVEKLEE